MRSLFPFLPFAFPHSSLFKYISLLGIVGDSNAMCYNSSSAMGKVKAKVGTVCSTDSDCLYGLCTNGVCVAPPLLCPTTVPGTFWYSNFSSSFFRSIFLFSLFRFSSLAYLCYPICCPIFLLYFSIFFLVKRPVESKTKSARPFLA